MAFARRESTVITAAKKYQAPKDERAQAKGQSHFSIKSFATIGIEPGLSPAPRAGGESAKGFDGYLLTPIFRSECQIG